MGRRTSATKNPVDNRHRLAVLQTIGLVLQSLVVLGLVVMAFQTT